MARLYREHEFLSIKVTLRKRNIIIAVVGGGQCAPEEAELAEQVGNEIARSGAILICGGLSGIMEAACKGANKAEGTAIGILPYDNPADANKYVTIPIVTGLGQARNVIIVKSAQSVIAVGGEYGTLSEIAIALKLGIPVIGLNTWALTKKGKKDNSIIEAKDAADAVALALKYASRAAEE